MKKVLTTMLAFMMFFSLALTGCGGNSGNQGGEKDPGKQGEEAEVQKSNKDTLVIALQGDFKAIGYAQNGRMISSILGPTLFNCIETDTGSYKYVLEGSAVESYKWNDDNTEITLTLKKDVPMHDGTKLDAEDIKGSLQIYAQYNSIASLNVDFDKIEVVDELNVKIPFKSAKVSNWDEIGQRMIFSKEAFEAVNDWDRFTQSEQFKSYGPYYITKWAGGDSIEMKKFDEYFAGNDSPIKNLIIRRIDEPTVAMMELQTGGVDMILYPAQTDIDDTIAGKNDNVKYLTCNGLYQQIMWFNLDKDSVCADPRVRQALCYAIDRQEIWKGAFESSGTFADTCATKTLEFMKPVEEPYPKDLEKAKQLLEEANFPFDKKLRVCVDTDPYRSTAVEMFKNALKDLGIECEVFTGDNASYLQQVVYTTDWDVEFGKTGNIGSIAYWFDTQWIFFSHGDTAKEDFSDYYKLRDEILAEFDDSKREELTDQFVKKFYDEWTFFYPFRQDEYATLVNKKLEGFSRAGEQLNFVGAYFAK